MICNYKETTNTERTRAYSFNFAMRRVIFISVLTLACLVPLRAAASESVEVVLDRSLYTAGETVWMRGWVTDKEAALPTSNFLYVELLRDGVGSVERRIKMKKRNGFFLGQMDLPDNLESGWYTLRAYTRAQKDWPAEALFHTRVLIRGTGPIRAIHTAYPATVDDDDTETKIKLDSAVDGRLSVTLTDTGGNPVVGDFALSVVSGLYADFDFQAPLSQMTSRQSHPEAPREYAQELDFRVKSVRGRLPGEYRVTIVSQDIGYYFSTEAAGDRSVKGAEGQLFRILDLDYPEETIFTVNVTGSKFIFPVAETEFFAEPSDYAPTYPVYKEIRDTAFINQRLERMVTPATGIDTIVAAAVSAERRPPFYRPKRMVGPYSNVFEWRQVKLRDELKKYDNMDLMTYIVSTWPGLVCIGNASSPATRSLYTTRGGNVTQRVDISHGKATFSTTASYRPVGLYMDGFAQSWVEAATLSVRNIQNIYVLRGTEAALYKAAAVVLLEMRHFDEEMLQKQDSGRKNTIGLMPLGWQQPKVFDRTTYSRPGTLYWNPCIRTNQEGHAYVNLPELPEDCYCRIVGQTIDGRFFSYSITL